MKNMQNVFEEYAPFIQDYIYEHGWDEIRPIQVAACEEILKKDNNLLLASGTASGKTEAAFLPILTDLYRNPSKSIGVLYISPLKALINDQFKRIEEILEETDIKVTKWHGDVSSNIKQKILKNPKGILQTTPESLEAMLMKNPGNVIKLFSDLRYIVIDEVHYFMNDDRGIQLLCILERIQRLIQIEPRRIGLSATLGNYELAKKWINTGTSRKCNVPIVPEEKRKIRLGVAYFLINEKEENNTILDYYNYMYKQTLNKKCILFSNSKAEVENNISHLKKIANNHKTKDIYYVHHANVSTSLRTYVEEQMKNDEEMAVTGATLTLELGIDLGRLDRIIQTGSPFSVSSFVQRLGRSGRRGTPSEMLFLFKNEESTKTKEFYEEIDFEFLKCIAIIELYLKEKWIEEIQEKSLPFSILYHQTMSYLYSMGGCLPKDLAKYILTLTPFKNISKEDYKMLLQHLVEKGEIEKDEEGNLQIGVKAEGMVNHFSFFSVFDTNLEYSVRSGSQEIGTVQMPYPIGQRFALASFTWKVIDVNEEKRQIFVSKVGGVATNIWNGDMQSCVHQKIMEKIKNILESTEEYRYLDKTGLESLKSFREIAKNARILEQEIVPICPNQYALFSWKGTKETFGLSYKLKQYGIENDIYLKNELPLFIQIKTDEELENLKKVIQEIEQIEIDKYKLRIPDNMEIIGKYNRHIPKELLKKQFIADGIE